MLSRPSRKVVDQYAICGNAVLLKCGHEFPSQLGTGRTVLIRAHKFESQSRQMILTQMISVKVVSSILNSSDIFYDSVYCTGALYLLAK